MTGRAIVACVAVGVVLSAAAFLRFRSGLFGTVITASGGGIPGAVVQVVNTASKEQFSVVAGPDGSFSLPGIPAGTYRLDVKVLGVVYPFGTVSVGFARRVVIDPQTPFNATLDTLGDNPEQMVRKQPPEGPAPRMPDGRTSFEGVWYRPKVVLEGSLELLPWARDKAEEHRMRDLRDDPEARCLPTGVPRFGGLMQRLVQTPHLLVVLYEYPNPPRQIFLDGRKLENLEPAWMGHSAGRWEGDTLVVETRGFNDKTWLTYLGEPHTAQLSVTERFRRHDLGHINVAITVNDPGALQKPWEYHTVLDLAPGEEVMEYVCNENNRFKP